MQIQSCPRANSLYKLVQIQSCRCIEEQRCCPIDDADIQSCPRAEALYKLVQIQSCRCIEEQRCCPDGAETVILQKSKGVVKGGAGSMEEVLWRLALISIRLRC